ncbi:Catalase [compost metagenome]
MDYEPSSLGGLKEAQPSGKEHQPIYQAPLVREKISRTNDFQQAGDTYRKFEPSERDELIRNLVDALSVCAPVIQDKMVEHFTYADPEYGQRVAEGLAQAKASQAHLGSTAAQEGAELADSSGQSTDAY